jgi:hypothetical protein
VKILIIQENGHHDENRHFRECFCLQRSLVKLNNDVDVWGLGHKNYEQPPEFDNYDLIINLENYDSFGWVPNLAEYKACKKFLWSIDAHCQGIDKYLQTFQQGKYDLILQATKNYLDGNSVWFPNCYDSSLIGIREKCEKKIDLGFCGSMINRKPLLDFLTSTFGLHQDIWVLGEKMVETVNSYWIHFNQNISHDINYRSFETLGCGTLLLTNYNPQYEELGFVDEVNCLMYKSGEDFKNKIQNYIGKYDKIKEIIAEGVVLAQQHTYDQRAQKLLEIYNDKFA